MNKLDYEDNEYEINKDESVLDCLLRHGVRVTNSCRSGICQSCLLKSQSIIDPLSQKGLSTSKKESGYFLSCQQKATNGLKVFKPDTSALIKYALITYQEKLNDSVVLIKLKPLEEYYFRAGQYVNLIRRDGVCRPYSIASHTGSDELELHIRKIPGGTMSSWLFDETLLNEKIQISESIGDCYLSSDIENKNLLLVGIGTGLAPLFGVIRDRLHSTTMSSRVTLFHGGLTFESLYMVEQLKMIEKENEFFTYHPVFLNGEVKQGFTQGNIVELINSYKYDILNTVVIVCGDPVLVKKIKQTVFLNGVPSKYILSDQFIISKPLFE